MKVGDLVIMPNRDWAHRGVENAVTGIVVEPHFVGPNGEKQQTPRVGVLWSDGEGVDWEPAGWLEVINENR